MSKEDYKERMKQEYWELKERYENLHKFIVNYEAGTLDFEPDCSLELLKRQAKAMGDYLFALEARAEISKVNLDTNDKQYWDGFDNGVLSTYEAVCDEIKGIRESDEQGDSLSILEDFVLEQKSVFELAFKRKEQENE